MGGHAQPLLHQKVGAQGRLLLTLPGRPRHDLRRGGAQADCTPGRQGPRQRAAVPRSSSWLSGWQSSWDELCSRGKCISEAVSSSAPRVRKPAPGMPRGMGGTPAGEEPDPETRRQLFPPSALQDSRGGGRETVTGRQESPRHLRPARPSPRTPKSLALPQTHFLLCRSR